MLKFIVGFIIWIIIALITIAFFKGANTYKYDKEDLK
jgi:hypothetical protein